MTSRALRTPLAEGSTSATSQSEASRFAYKVVRLLTPRQGRACLPTSASARVPLRPESPSVSARTGYRSQGAHHHK